MFQYDKEFYKVVEKLGNDEEIIIPKIVQWLSPKSVVDFGCGEGIWLREILRQDGKIDILGIDGSYIDQKRLKISKDKFMAADLRQEVMLKRKFDLAISTEVAEHIEEKYTDVFMDNLTKASDQVLFSAAVPGQTGIHHVNEQWQSYWVKKFEDRGYYCDYSVRNYFWNEMKINSWRKQNLMFFSKYKTNIAPDKYLIDIVHPEEAIRRQRDFEKSVNDNYLMLLEKYIKLDLAITKLVKENKKIAIYPYGFNGHICENILLLKYKKKDYIIVDNKIKSKKVITAKQLKEVDNKILVLNTCNNPLIYNEVKENIKKYVDEKYIYNVFDEIGDI